VAQLNLAQKRMDFSSRGYNWDESHYDPNNRQCNGVSLQNNLHNTYGSLNQKYETKQATSTTSARQIHKHPNF